MSYNNDAFCKVSDALTDSLYSNNNWDEINIPPPTTQFLIDNEGVSLLDNTGAEFITVE